LLLFVAALIGSSPAHASNSQPDTAATTSTSSLIARWMPFIHEASNRFGVAEDWIQAVMRMESGGHTHSADGHPITSRAGAMGLMQLMPQTWNEMRSQYGLGTNPFDPHDNVIAGTAYLRTLYQRFGFPKMFAAYNAGPGTVDAEAQGLRDLPLETRNYIRGIASMLGSGANAQQSDQADNPPQQSADAPKLTRVAAGASDPMAKLTRPDGLQVVIDASTVSGIRSVLPNEYTSGVQSVVSMASHTQGVLESPADVAAILRRHGAKL
jgi:hypothetical protein